MDVLNNIVDVGEDGKNTLAWAETAPRGYEAVQILQVVNDLADLIVKSLATHVKSKEISPKDAKVKITKKNLGNCLLFSFVCLHNVHFLVHCAHISFQMVGQPDI